MTLQRIVSGAQTGADRAALDAALEAGFPIGGWVPKGRLDENGRIPEHYPNLREADSEKPKVRTRLNVRDSDATLILSHGPLTGGSKYTLNKTLELGKPVLHLDLDVLSLQEAVAEASTWLAHQKPSVLNVAGPRASNDPAIYADTKEILRRLLPTSSSAPATL